MKTRYFISYDIADPRRWRKVFKVMKGAGERVQYSVFQCEMSDREREQLILDLAEIISASEDQVMFIDLGPADGRALTCITAIGKPYSPPSRGPVIV